MKKLFTFFFTLAASVGTIFSEMVKIDGYGYVLDTTAKTAEVTSFSMDYSNLKKVTIPSSIKYCSVTYSVTSIGDFTFYNCDSLISVTLPNSITHIGDYAFEDCNGLTSIVLPNSITHIGKSAFQYCSSLVYATIPNSITSIERYTFSGCTNLSYITPLPNSVITIEDYAFQNCRALTSIDIPNSVTRIGEHAFGGCDGLTSITIPNSVFCIGDQAFSCRKLTSIVVNKENPIYDSRDNCNAIIESPTNTLITGCINSVIPNSVTSIENGAFSSCRDLVSVTIPKSVTSIGYSNFESYQLESVICHAEVPPIMKCGTIFGTHQVGVFGDIDCSKLILYVPEESISAYQIADQWKDFGTILPITTDETGAKDVEITPNDNSIDIVWPAISGAATYELVIKDQQGTIVCTLVFNANGQLTSITFNAPARDNVPQQKQDSNFVFTINGLESGTNYDLIFFAKDSNGVTLLSKTIAFTTKGDAPTAINQITNTNANAVKFLRNGSVYILRGDKTYTLTGQEVK